MELAPFSQIASAHSIRATEFSMKSLHFRLGLAAATAVAMLACGFVTAQTPTDGDRANPTPAAGGPTSSTESNPGGRSAASGGAVYPPNGPSSMAQSQVNREATQAFVTQAAQASRAEIEEAKYVMDHTTSQTVKNFAEKMASDHTTALDQLKQIASTDGYTIPNGVDSKNQASLDSLKQKQGARMNLAYSSDQEKDHREVISKFEEAAQNRQIAPAVRDYARILLPLLKEHLRMAQQLVASESNDHRKTG
jgi:putative membrane protein